MKLVGIGASFTCFPWYLGLIMPGYPQNLHAYCPYFSLLLRRQMRFRLVAWPSPGEIAFSDTKPWDSTAKRWPSTTTNTAPSHVTGSGASGLAFNGIQVQSTGYWDVLLQGVNTATFSSGVCITGIPTARLPRPDQRA
jgi:hypothetical protein